MEYGEKLAIANAYISKKTDGLEWNDLADINSLHDCDSQEDIFAACDERLEDSGFPVDDVEDEEDEKDDVVHPEDIEDILAREAEEDDDDVMIPSDY